MANILKQFRYFIEAIFAYFFYFIFWLIGIDAASYTGGKIARILGPYLKVSNNALRNLKYAIPELSEKEIETIVKDMWENLGRVAGEIPHIKSLTGDNFLKRVEIKNVERINKIRDEDKTGILVSGHFANWEVGPKSGFELGVPMTVIYRHANNPWLDMLIQRSRSSVAYNIAPKGRGAAKEAIKTLRNKGFIGILLDQKMNDGIETKFFGRKVMSAPAAAELALKFRCPILPAIVTRKKGANFTLHFLEEINVEGRKPKDIIQEINDLYESWARKNPSQWLWLHNRWPKDAFK